MTRDLIARAAAAQAAADAARVPRCKWCRDTHDLHDLPAGGFECGDPDACHERFLALHTPQRPEDTGDLSEGPETDGTDALDSDDLVLVIELIDALMALHDSGAIPVDLRPETRLGIKSLRAKIRAAL